MAHSFHIRPLETEDFPGFLGIQREALANSPELFGSDYEWFSSLSILSIEQRFEKYLNFPYTYLLGAFLEDGSLAGMIGFSTENASSKLRHKGRVWGLFVIERYRGAGIASKLMESVLLTSRDILGCEQIHCSVSSQNKASYNLYLLLGFSIYGTEVHSMKIDDSYVDEYLMVKFLL